MSNMVLFLDDDPQRHTLITAAIPGATHVQTAAQAIELLRTRRWNTVMLDHDLDQFGAKDPGTGEDVVDWVVDHAARFRSWGTLFVVHSHNWMFGPVMFAKLKAAGLNAIRYRAAETDRFFLNKVRVADRAEIAAAAGDPDNRAVPTQIR